MGKDAFATKQRERDRLERLTKLLGELNQGRKHRSPTDVPQTPIADAKASETEGERAAAVAASVIYAATALAEVASSATWDIHEAAARLIIGVEDLEAALSRLADKLEGASEQSTAVSQGIRTLTKLLVAATVASALAAVAVAAKMWVG